MNIEDIIKARHKLNENSVDGEWVVSDMKLLICLVKLYREMTTITISKKAIEASKLEPEEFVKGYDK